MYFLGIDVGTGGTRALVVDERGGVVASATEEHQAFASPRIGWAEQDPRDWWRACGAVVRIAGNTTPNSEDSLAMEKAYAVYRRIYPAMKSILR